MSAPEETTYSMSKSGMGDFETAIAGLIESCRTEFETKAAEIIGVNDLGVDTCLADENAKSVKSLVDNELEHLAGKVKDIITANQDTAQVVEGVDKYGQAMFDNFNQRSKPTPTTK